MGQDYSVQAKFVVENEELAVKALKEFVSNKTAEGHTKFNFENSGVKRLSSVKKFDTAIKCVFPNLSSKCEYAEIWGDCEKACVFHGSYGWHSVIVDFMSHMAPQFGNGTILYVGEDEQEWVCRIKEHVSSWECVDEDWEIA